MPKSVLAEEKREPGSIQAAILLLTSGLTTLVVAVLGPSLPNMQAHFASTAGAEYLVPLVITMPMIVMAFLSVFAGLLSDHAGRKQILVWSTVLYSIFGTAPLWLQSLPSILGSRLLLGVSEAALMTVSTTLIGDYYFGARRQKLMALQTTVSAALAFILNVIGGAVGEFGWRAPYLVYSVSLPLAILMAIFIWEPSRHAIGLTADEAIHSSAAFQPKTLLGLCGVAVIVGVVFLIVPVHLGFLFGALGVRSSTAIGIAYGLNSLGIVLGTIWFGWNLSSRITIHWQLALSFALAGIGLLVMAAARNYSALTAGAITNGLGAGVLLPTVVTWNMRELPFRHRGFGVGAFQSSLFLGMFVSPILLVSLQTLLGTRGAVIGGMGYALVAAAAAAAAIEIVYRRR